MSDCKECHGTGKISYSVLHPSNPNLDTWGSYTCDCVYKRLQRLEAEKALEATRQESKDYREGYDAGFKAGLIAAKELGI